MSALKVRKIDFQFDDTIAFQWNPGNSYWGNFVNYATIIAPAFERYFIKATRQAMPLISSGCLKTEAELFCAQEAQHSKHHLAHLAMLTKKYPGLAAVRIDVLASYENLFETESTDFHLAYAAVIEQCFGPFAQYIIENREHLFIETDTRIASFILWHLVEEFEHRNAAIDIYNDVVGDYFYRLKTSFRVFKHIADIDQIVRQGLKQAVPSSPGEIGPSESVRFARDIPLRHTATLIVRLLSTLLPYHNPDNIKQPAWVTQWLADEEAGVDMRFYYPAVSP